MAIVYPIDHLVKIRIKDVTFHVRPLTGNEKIEITAMMTKQEGTLIENLAKTTYYMMRIMIKEVEGLQTPNGKKWSLRFKDAKITDECLDELTNIQLQKFLGPALNNFLAGVPSELLHPQTGEKLEGVEIITDESDIEVKK